MFRIRMKFNYIADLNPIQLKIVTTVTGPIIVIAGAGSGKTRILTYRIAHLMNQGIDRSPPNPKPENAPSKASPKISPKLAKISSIFIPAPPE